MPVCVYILQSVNFDYYYVGQSENPHVRLEYHNTTERGFTARYRPWKLVYIKECANRTEAKKLERRIKSWKSRKMIEKLLRGEITLE
jgi:predicted GIY-YIG superfamily endonuclease